MVKTLKSTYLNMILLRSKALFARRIPENGYVRDCCPPKELLPEIPNLIFFQENQERSFITHPFPFLTIVAKHPFSPLPKSVPKGRGPTSHVASMPKETLRVGKMPHALWVFFSFYFIFLSSWEILKLNFPIKFPQALVVSSDKITSSFC